MKKICNVCKIKKDIFEFKKRKDNKDGYSCVCKNCCNKKQQLYRKTINGKISVKKYQQSEKGKLTRQKYEKSEKGKLKFKRYRKTEGRKQTQQKYEKSEKGKLAQKRKREKYRISQNISSYIRQSLNGKKDNKHWENLVGYTLQELKYHIEKQFKLGMNWNNYGLYGWHIDHIKPVSLFNITNYNCNDFKKCWSLSNLQPLWAEENWKKGNKEI